MIRDSYLRHLASVPLFSNCTKSQLQEIGKVADELILPVGKVLACQGEVGFEMFILIDGAAAVTRDGQHVDGHRRRRRGGIGCPFGSPTQRNGCSGDRGPRSGAYAEGLEPASRRYSGLAKHMLYEVTARIVEGSRRVRSSPYSLT